MEKSEILNLEIRRKIINYVKDNPGLHLHELARQLNMNYHALRYHLNHLKKHDMISLKSNNSYTHVYAKEINGKREKEIFNIIRQETPRNILLVFIVYIISTQKDLSELLEKDQATIQYHLKKLQKLNLIKKVETKNGKTIVEYSKKIVFKRKIKPNEKIFALNDVGLILRIFWTYKHSLKNDVIFQFALKQWLDSYHRSQKEKKSEVNDLKNWIDKKIEFFTDILFDIFPPPYIA